MRIAFLTGIWPPDVGGPATHGPEFARFLVARGHEVVRRDDGGRRARRAAVRGRGGRRAAPAFPSATRGGASRAGRARRTPTSLYATATYAAAAALRPLARRRSSSSSSPTLPTSALGATGSSPARSRSSRRVDAGGRGAEGGPDACAARGPGRSSSRVPTSPGSPGWGLDRARITVLHNPAPLARGERRALAPGTFAFVGRLTRQKDLDVAIDAVAHVPEARLVVVGDGPDRARLEAGRSPTPERPTASRSSGALPRDEALAHSPVPTRRALERLGELPARRGRGARGRCPGRRDRGRRRPGDRARRRERPARAAGLERTSSLPRCAGSLDEPGLRDVSPPRASPRSHAISADRVYGRLEAILVEAAR